MSRTNIYEGMSQQSVSKWSLGRSLRFCGGMVQQVIWRLAGRSYAPGEDALRRTEYL